MKSADKYDKSSGSRTEIICFSLIHAYRFWNFRGLFNTAEYLCWYWYLEQKGSPQWQVVVWFARSKEWVKEEVEAASMGDAANAMWIRSVHKYDCCLHTIYLEPNWYCIFAWNTEMISTMKSFTHQKRRHESPTLFSTRNRVLMWGVNCGYPLLKILLSDGSLHRGQDSCQWDCNRFVPKPEVESVRSGWDLLCFFDILCFLAPHKGVWRIWQSGIVWFIDQFAFDITH